MASIDEVLAGMDDPELEDEELCFVIDRDFRVIAIPERGAVLGVEGDKDVNRVRFKMPRYYRGTDLSDFDIRVHYENADGDRFAADAEEKTVGNDSIRFTWVVSADALATRGSVRFMVKLLRKDTDGKVMQAFGTTIGVAANLEGLETGE